MAFFELHTIDRNKIKLSFSAHDGILHIEYKGPGGYAGSFTLKEPAKDFIEKLSRLEEISNK